MVDIVKAVLTISYQPLLIPEVSLLEKACSGGTLKTCASQEWVELGARK